MIRLTVPSIDQSDLEAVERVLASGFLVQGPKVAEFESQVAAYVGTRHAVAVANCTAALHLALLALDVGPGDRVAVTTYSWPATANVIALCGAEPLFVDVDPRTFNLDPEALRVALRDARVKAIMPVHAFGGFADMPRLLEIAAEHGVPIIEDAACALGTEHQGRKAGAWGEIGCFSFHPRKAITTGEGGIITTDDDRMAKRLRVLRNHGLDPDAPTPDFIAPGYNLRLTEFQAALGTSQLCKLERIIDARRAVASRYDSLLGAMAVTTPSSMPTSRHVYQSYVVLLPAHLAHARGQIVAALRSNEVEVTIGTYHMPMTTYFRERYGVRAGMYPVTDDVAGRALSLPLYEGITEQEQRQVADALSAAISSHGGG